MPPINVVFYKEADGDIPVRNWLDQMARRDQRIVAKCLVAFERLAELGHELRRPEADYLHDGIYELRVRLGNVNYRILYFFDSDGQAVAVRAHGLTKGDHVPPRDIAIAIDRRERFQQDRKAHTVRGDEQDEANH